MDSERFRKLLEVPAPFASVYFDDSHDRTLRVDEALPLFAISVGASLVVTDERIASADGVAALLRYAPTLHQPVG